MSERGVTGIEELKKAYEEYKKREELIEELIKAYEHYKQIGGTLTFKQFTPLWVKGGI